MSTIEERVKKIVAEQLGVKEEEVVNTASFVEDLGADSLDTVELVMALEEEFETEIPDEEAENHYRSSCNRLRYQPPGVIVCSRRLLSGKNRTAVTACGFFFSSDEK